jgi:hypothetical protein
VQDQSQGRLFTNAREFGKGIDGIFEQSGGELHESKFS